MISPEQLAKSGSEDSHQKALFCWASLNLLKYPQLKFLFHIPNGGSRHIAEAGKLKAMGVKRGVPDICLPVQMTVYYPNSHKHYSGLFIELKRPEALDKKAGSVSKEQQEWLDFLISQGYACHVCYGWMAARDVIVGYLNG